MDYTRVRVVENKGLSGGEKGVWGRENMRCGKTRFEWWKTRVWRVEYRGLGGEKNELWIKENMSLRCGKQRLGGGEMEF